jgi:hypothetical protein
MKRIWFDRDVRILGTWSIKGNAPDRIYCPIVISKTKIFLEDGNRATMYRGLSNRISASIRSDVA